MMDYLYLRRAAVWHYHVSTEAQSGKTVPRASYVRVLIRSDVTDAFYECLSLLGRCLSVCYTHT